MLVERFEDVLGINLLLYLYLRNSLSYLPLSERTYAPVPIPPWYSREEPHSQTFRNKNQWHSQDTGVRCDRVIHRRNLALRCCECSDLIL